MDGWAEVVSVAATAASVAGPGQDQKYQTFVLNVRCICLCVEGVALGMWERGEEEGRRGVLHAVRFSAVSCLLLLVAMLCLFPSFARNFTLTISVSAFVFAMYIRICNACVCGVRVRYTSRVNVSSCLCMCLSTPRCMCGCASLPPDSSLKVICSPCACFVT